MFKFKFKFGGVERRRGFQYPLPGKKCVQESSRHTPCAVRKNWSATEIFPDVQIKKTKTTAFRQIR